MTHIPISERFRVSRCYDSHVHWLPSGQLESFLDLHGLQDPEGVKDLALSQEFYRGPWLIGFGWNQHNWSQKTFPDKKILDEIFPDTPVFFSRADGHAAWTNSCGLKIAGLADTTEADFPSPAGGTIVRGKDGLPTGVLIDKAMGILEQKIPAYSQEQLMSFLRKSTARFNQAGFTHIRDMGGDPDTWNLAQIMDTAGDLSLAVEMNFVCKDFESFEPVLHFCRYAKGHSTPHLRALGVKFYLDGALGSEGAYISKPYRGTQHRGLLLCEKQEIREILRKCWESGLEAAVHAIGDEACHIVALEALALQEEEGLRGVLNVEHGEMIRDETIAILKKTNSRVYFQPCHWWTDKVWLKDKLDDLYAYVFPWRKLEDAGIEFYFGSDSPIEKPSVLANLKALDDCALNGIPSLRHQGIHYHTHPDTQWGEGAYTLFEHGIPKEIVFDKQTIPIEAQI